MKCKAIDVTLVINNIRIRRFDDKNIVLERFVIPTKKDKEGSWKIYGYYGKFDDLIDTLVRLLVDIPPANDLVAQIAFLNENIIQTRNTILEAIKLNGAALTTIVGATNKSSGAKTLGAK